MVSFSEDIFQETYGKVKKLIVTKKLTPGQLITQQRLSHTLNIKDETIPVVLQQLQEESLLVGKLDNGFAVRELSEQDICEMFDCRLALETMTVKLFTLNVPQSKIDDLRNLLVPFEKGPQNVYVFHKIDRYFHEFIAKNCGNRIMYELFKSAKILPFMDLVGLARPLNAILQEHLNIVSAMHQRDEEMAIRAIQLHLQNTKKSHI
ncbi:GntR family transcriptional regulator [Maribacter sp. ACAM166]|uniref:GntR family transcriptional regulator n=1 Tax=Maribacter sp. ACAM166 TaxID=2508996 RepID=UPI0010FDBC62|nr:GntR family transcriptional regulator [Maribacter sp. ACAM166]TLP75407.1 GntR family transcriptional regulator [Maribacter sp. ACAM166]